MSETRCPQCGTTVTGGGAFCPSCGANVTTPSTWAPPPPGAAPTPPDWGAPPPPGPAPPPIGASPGYAPPAYLPPPPTKTSSSWSTKRIVLVTGGFVLLAALAFVALLGTVDRQQRSFQDAFDEEFADDFGAPYEGYGDYPYDEDWWYPIAGTQLLAGEDVVLQVIDGGVEAIDPATGEVRWYTALCQEPSWAGWPAAPQTAVVVFCGNLAHGLDLHTGEPLWSRPVETELRDFTVLAADVVVLPTGEVDDGFDQVALQAFDVESGEALWESPVPPLRIPDGRLQPAAARGGFVALAAPGSVSLRDAGTGAPLWSVEANAGALCVGDAVVVVRTVAGEVVAFESDTGTERWRSRPYPDTGITSCVEDLVVLDGLEGLTVLDVTDGQPRWTTPLGGAHISLTPDRVVAWSGPRGALEVYDRETGTAVPHSLEPPERPVVLGDRLYFAEPDYGELVTEEVP